MAKKQKTPKGKSWYVERGKNAGKNKKEDWEYPAKMRAEGRTKVVKAYTRSDGTRVRQYWRKSTNDMI